MNEAREPIWVMIRVPGAYAEVPGWIVERDPDDPVVTIEYEWADRTHSAVVSATTTWIPMRTYDNGHTLGVALGLDICRPVVYSFWDA